MLDRMLWPAGVPWPEGQVELLSEITKADANALLRHWRGPSQLQWVRAGLTNLPGILRDNDIQSIAVPPLGCGLGGLSWPDVRHLIVEHLSGLPTEVLVYGSASGRP